MDDLTSHRSGSVPPYIRGGASEPEDVEDDTVYQSADYDPVGVSRAIAKLNKTLARAQKRAASGPANDDIVTTLMQRIAWLKSQRDYAEGSDGSSPSTAGMRGGAGQTDDADYDSVEEDIDPEQQDVDNEDDWIRNYNHRAVTQAILNLHGELGAALNLVAKLEREIVRLKMQRDIQDGSDIIQQILERNRDVYSASFGMMRGGAGDDDYDEEFRVRHPECSSDTADTVGPELLELDKEIRRLNLFDGESSEVTQRRQEQLGHISPVTAHDRSARSRKRCSTKVGRQLQYSRETRREKSERRYWGRARCACMREGFEVRSGRVSNTTLAT